MMEYKDFLKTKQIKDVKTGFDPIYYNENLYDFQDAIESWAIKRGRAAIFADCGLGKTPMQLIWAENILRKTNMPIIILAPLAVSKQTKREGEKFGIEVNVVRNQDQIVKGINITNYENLHNFDPNEFSGIVLDESSILKSFSGKYRNEIISCFLKTPYKLACTATPSPNDYMELGNHSEFLGIITRSEMLSMFFINDTSNVGTWRLKGHGQDEFWKWLCSWAVMIQKPSDIGFDDSLFILPKLNVVEHEIEHGEPLPGNLFVQQASTLHERRLARRETIEKRCGLIADMVCDSNEKWLIWCNLNDEGTTLKNMISDAIEIKGQDTIEHKENSMLGFSNGDIRVLITKPKIAGFGVNWQSCHNIAFAGISDSYESYYQCVRRCWRFGQKHPVNVHIVTADIELNVLDNIKRKEKNAQDMADNMLNHMRKSMNEEIKGSSRFEYKLKNDHSSGPGWDLYLGDCVDICKEIESESIDYSIFSPPFASLFTYTNSINDMGNCTSLDEFKDHFIFLVDELYRLIAPGRLVSIHCMNLPATIQHDGFIGMKDFRGDIIRLFESKGFIFHSEVCIWKDPLVQAVRTKVLTLAHKQVVSDSSRCAQGFPDYIVTMRKPGINKNKISRGRGFEEYIGERDEPKKHKTNNPKTNKYSHEVWQRYASPVWFDIRQTRVLSSDIARESEDEKHVCPLQLDVIERCLELWSAKNDLILSPFAGIGSEIYSAVKMERRAIGIELKESYYSQVIKNLDLLKVAQNQISLFE